MTHTSLSAFPHPPSSPTPPKNHANLTPAPVPTPAAPEVRCIRPWAFRLFPELRRALVRALQRLLCHGLEIDRSWGPRKVGKGGKGLLSYLRSEGGWGWFEEHNHLLRDYRTPPYGWSPTGEPEPGWKILETAAGPTDKEVFLGNPLDPHTMIVCLQGLPANWTVLSSEVEIRHEISSRKRQKRLLGGVPGWLYK